MFGIGKSSEGTTILGYTGKSSFGLAYGASNFSRATEPTQVDSDERRKSNQDVTNLTSSKKLIQKPRVKNAPLDRFHFLDHPADKQF